jgi:uncharacterized coiled-coil protein SlyX
MFTGLFENENSYDPDFSNSYFGYQVRGIINTNNLFQTYKITRRLNPYFFLGLGLLHSDLEVSGQADRNFRSVMFTPGIGTKIYLNNWVDIFIQYEMNFTRHKQLEGVAGLENDRFSSVNAGLNFNIGKRGARLASWQIYEPGVPLTQEDVDRFNRAADRITTVESRVNDQQRRINELDSKIDARTSNLENQISQLSGRQDNFETRLANLEQRIADDASGRGRGLEVDEAGLARGLGHGHYIQVFAATDFASAQRVRDNTVEMMREFWKFLNQGLLLHSAGSSLKCSLECSISIPRLQMFCAQLRADTVMLLLSHFRGQPICADLIRRESKKVDRIIVRIIRHSRLFGGAFVSMILTYHMFPGN